MLRTQSKLKGNLSADLARFEKHVQEKVTLSGAALMAWVIYDEARQNAELHKQSGTLHSAIYRRYAKEKSTDKVKTYQISWNRKQAPHGHFLEFGTSRAPAYPFLTPAFSCVREAIAKGKERMAESLKVAGDTISAKEGGAP